MIHNHHRLDYTDATRVCRHCGMAGREHASLRACALALFGSLPDHALPAVISTLRSELADREFDRKTVILASRNSS